MPEGTAAAAPTDHGRGSHREPQRPTRAVIVHYHLFKNAGTSVDRTLRDSLGASWTTTEGERRGLRPHEVGRFLVANPWVRALSSHTAMLPAPSLPGVVIIPIIFVRHPLDRIRSVYDFEREQDADTAGARTAKQTDLAGYIEWRLERARTSGDRAVTDFQTHRLALGSPGPEAPLRRALETVDRLPFVGLVECYEHSIERLQAVLAEHFPEMRLQAFQDNTTETGRGPLDERLDRIRRRIGGDLFERLETANQDDLQLWRVMRERFPC